MRREGIGGPVVISLFLLAVIIGLVAYVGRDNLEDDYDVPEWEETATMIADSTETKVIFESPENIEIQEETPREKMEKKV